MTLFSRLLLTITAALVVSLHLTVRAEPPSIISLDTGRLVSQNEIEAVADAYWTEWSLRQPE